MLDKET